MKKINQIEPSYDEKEITAVTEYLKSGGWITEHKKTRELEQMIASFVGTRYCAILPNGTLTLFAALSVLGVGPGDEVIVPDFTMVATANAVKLSGASPVFVDINEKTLCLDVAATERSINKKTKVIFLVSMNGRCSEMDKFVALAKKHKVVLLEDAAQAFGSKVDGKYLGTFGVFGSFSFSMPKVITMGQGGALVTDDEEKYKKLLKFKDFGRSESGNDNYEMLGYNLKFSDLLAVFGIEQMKKLDGRLAKKREIFGWYQEFLKEVVQVRFIETSAECSPWFVDVLVERREQLRKYLSERGIATRPFYPALHSLPFYNQSGSFPKAQFVSDNGLWLPSSVTLSRGDVEVVCNSIKEFYR